MKSDSAVPASDPIPASDSGACWQAWFDGAAHPNPGVLGIGVVLQSPDGQRQEISRRGAGNGCSNEAEMQALCAALALSHAAGATRLVLRGDSDFAVRHGVGSTRTVAPRLKQWVDEALAWMARFEVLELCWVPRHRNGDADRLSRAALGLVPKPAPHPGKLPVDRKRWRRR
ncbi:ribonuclease HI family protein [Azoarcus sp. L1K30]|uniref:ribonuclease HI family protein n=1 Tax=Azoarcus sp. L1K30 TaxID=2820277 RepID=UPI001B81EBB3|nr:ribonuclease HI family protein [Azoarcus sp. L1K30]MBR0565915.1 ribonuclease HI family protein [Azoarcus sp. L1K30]